MKSPNWNKTCVVLSNAPEGKRYHIPRSLLVVIIALVCILVLAGAGGIFYALSVSRTYTWQRTELERLQEENQKQQFEIQDFSRKISFMNDQIERFEDFHTKFKMLAQKDLNAGKTKFIRRSNSLPVTASSSIFPENTLKRQVEEMYLELDELRAQSLHREKDMYQMESVLELEQSLSTSTPTRWPTFGISTIWPTIGMIMSNFGKRLSPFTGRLQMHNGIDISNHIGTPVRATADGVVLYRGWEGDYGNTIILDHGKGYVSKYAHLSHMYVNHGDSVHRGDIIGTVGVTGNATGPHLHYEVNMHGRPVNPLKYLPE